MCNSGRLHSRWRRPREGSRLGAAPVRDDAGRASVPLHYTRSHTGSTLHIPAASVVQCNWFLPVHMAWATTLQLLNAEWAIYLFIILDHSCLFIPWVAAEAVHWPGIPIVACRVSVASASLVIYDPHLRSKIRGAQVVLPCVGCGVTAIGSITSDTFVRRWLWSTATGLGIPHWAISVALLLVMQGKKTVFLIKKRFKHWYL